MTHSPLTSNSPTTQPHPITTGKRKRPKLFRALGKRPIPSTVYYKGYAYFLIEKLKHDSWAATGIYQLDSTTVPSQNLPEKILCKFNRQQSVFGIPMRWLGRWLAQRELQFFRQLNNLPNIPNVCDNVIVDGNPLASLSAHEYIEGCPLKAYSKPVPDTFFPELLDVLTQLHQQHIVYVDLNKQENIIVGEDQRPYLIDFQISFQLRPSWVTRCVGLNTLFDTLKRVDIYHLYKHYTKRRPDQFSPGELAIHRRPPRFIRIYRLFQTPIRNFRRKILVWIGVRTEKGYAHTEQFLEDALRRLKQQNSQTTESKERSGDV